MKLIENGLIPIMENEKGDQLVDGRKLHEYLNVQKDFSDWIKNQLENTDATENVDFSTLKGSANNGGGIKIDYVLTLDIAKEICMIAGATPRANDETKRLSKEARKYFISIEKRAKQKQFESIDHFKKEQMMLEFVMDKLKVNEGSKIKMIKQFNKVHNLSTEYLPDYTEEKLTKSLSELLKQFNIGMSPIRFNSLLIENGFLEEKERPSKSKGTKKFKVLTKEGLKYGKNLISTQGNQAETQPHYYEDTFTELANLALSQAERKCS